MQHSLSLPAHQDYEDCSSAPGTSENSCQQPCELEAEMAPAEVCILETAQRNDGEETEHEGRRSSKRICTGKAAASTAPPAAADRSMDISFLSCRGRRTGAASRSRDGGRNSRGPAASVGRSPARADLQMNQSGSNSGPRQKRGSATAHMKEQKSSAIPVRCTSPMSASGVRGTQGLEGECDSSQMSVVSVLEQLITMIKTLQQSPAGVKDNAAGVWSALAPASNVVPQPTFAVDENSNIKVAIGGCERIDRECMPCLLSPLGFHLAVSVKRKYGGMNI